MDQADYADSSLEKEPPDLFCCDWLLEEEKGECLVAVGGSDGVLVVCAPETGSHKVNFPWLPSSSLSLSVFTD